MADWSKPTLTSTYTNFLTELSTRIDDAGKLSRSDTVTLTNPPVGTIRWNTTSAKWQTNTGTVAVPVWSDLAATYGISISGNAATATTATSATSATSATTATNQSGGTVSATTLSASSTVTLSGGTANGVPYLNASKVLTSGTALVFDGANLGMAVTPAAWGSQWKALQINTGASIYGAATYTIIGQNVVGQATTDNYISTGAASRYYQFGGQHIWNTAPSGTAGAAITFTQAMTLDASGNLGVGVTPSAWFASSKALQIGTAGVIEGRVGTAVFQVGCNWYLDSAGAYKYTTTAQATRYASNNGQHAWYTAPSGTAGTAITFTQPMTLDASGNLISAATGYWQLPIGTTAQRPAGASGQIRFNSTLSKYEGHNGTAWAAIGGGATGGGTDDVFVENGQTVNTNYTITSGKNAMSAGPITIASGITVTVPSGSTWVVV